MAFDLGFWLGAQISLRFGDCITWERSSSIVVVWGVVGFVCVVVGAAVGASNCLTDTAKVRVVAFSSQVRLRAARNLENVSIIAIFVVVSLVSRSLYRRKNKVIYS